MIDHDDLAFGDCAKEAWKNYYNRLLNEEFEWDKDGLSSAKSIPGPAVRIKRERAKVAICKMNSGKAAWYCSRNVEGFR